MKPPVHTEQRQRRASGVGVEAELRARQTLHHDVLDGVGDLRFASGHTTRAEAGRRLVAEFSDHAAAEPDWKETKAALERDLDTKLP